MRYDIECDGRHAKIAFTDNWQEYAKRRDFTFNALYLDVEGRVFDYFFGLKDLQCKRLCFVGDIKTRIEEDYLRILRAFRFHAKICTQDLDKKILFACKQYKNRIDDISGERIYSEMKKLLSYPSAIEECIVMQSCEVLKKICNFSVIFSNINILRASEVQDPLVKLAVIVKNCDIKSSKALNWLQKRWKIAKKIIKN